MRSLPSKIKNKLLLKLSNKVKAKIELSYTLMKAEYELLKTEMSFATFLKNHECPEETVRYDPNLLLEEYVKDLSGYFTTSVQDMLCFSTAKDFVFFALLDREGAQELLDEAITLINNYTTLLIKENMAQAERSITYYLNNLEEEEICH